MDHRPPSSWLRRTGEVSLVAAAVAFVPQTGGGLGPLGIALVVAFLILSLGIHEAAHAWVADRCGDSTAREQGRLTLNPIAHIDLWMTILLPAMLALAGAPIFGGAKPVPVTYHRLRHPPRDMALVAIAGPASNFLLAILFLIAWKLSVGPGGYSGDSLMANVLGATVLANLVLTAFNLLPIPPLDGSRVMAYILPASMRPAYVSLDRFGILIVFALVYFVPPVREVIIETRGALLRLIDGLTANFG